MMQTTMRDGARNKWRKVAISAGIGMLFGFAGAFGLVRLSESGALGSLDVSREIAALIGMVYIFTAAVVGAGVASPSIGASFLNVEDSDELREQRRLLGASAVSMLATGLALVLLALAQPVGIVPPAAALALAVALLAVVTVLGITQRRAMDELMRRVSLEGGSLAFYLTAMVGGGWAMLAHLGFAGAPAPLDWLTLFAGLLLVAAFITCAKRGLLAPR